MGASIDLLLLFSGMISFSAGVPADITPGLIFFLFFIIGQGGHSGTISGHYDVFKIKL